MVANTLYRPTLVLNRNWQPVNVATVARALVLVWNESARWVGPDGYRAYTWAACSHLRPCDGDPFIQGVRLQLRAPEVIVLAQYDRLPSAAVSFSRRNLFKRDHWTCQYCGVQPGADELTIDHVVPRSQGGTSTWENRVLACIVCNKRMACVHSHRGKADGTPQQAGMKLRHAPVRPLWKPMYARHTVRIESWSKFVSEAYWNVKLEE